MITNVELFFPFLSPSRGISSFHVGVLDYLSFRFESMDSCKQWAEAGRRRKAFRAAMSSVALSVSLARSFCHRFSENNSVDLWSEITIRHSVILNRRIRDDFAYAWANNLICWFVSTLPARAGHTKSLTNSGSFLPRRRRQKKERAQSSESCFSKQISLKSPQCCLKTVFHSTAAARVYFSRARRGAERLYMIWRFRSREHVIRMRAS